MFDVLPWNRNKDKHAKELRREVDSIYDRFLSRIFCRPPFLAQENGDPN
jgi:hypothetical protein